MKEFLAFTPPQKIISILLLHLKMNYFCDKVFQDNSANYRQYCDRNTKGRFYKLVRYMYQPNATNLKKAPYLTKCNCPANNAAI